VSPRARHPIRTSGAPPSQPASRVNDIWSRAGFPPAHRRTVSAPPGWPRPSGRADARELAVSRDPRRTASAVHPAERSGQAARRRSEGVAISMSPRRPTLRVSDHLGHAVATSWRDCSLRERAMRSRTRDASNCQVDRPAGIVPTIALTLTSRDRLGDQAVVSTSTGRRALFHEGTRGGVHGRTSALREKQAPSRPCSDGSFHEHAAVSRDAMDPPSAAAPV
jgi:hypothetical protein